ncbi:hypothetical protein NL676_020212 [Syzygium grande]|nr:hypothetical protein NL676_020212 [Syzygium grande]
MIDSANGEVVVHLQDLEKNIAGQVVDAYAVTPELNSSCHPSGERNDYLDPPPPAAATCDQGFILPLPSLGGRRRSSRGTSGLGRKAPLPERVPKLIAYLGVQDKLLYFRVARFVLVICAAMGMNLFQQS